MVRQKPAKLPFPSSNLGATLLVLVATPIGNLEDLSERARSALASCDCVLCEDTRHTGLLFQSLHISPPQLISFHRLNEASRENAVLALLREGKTVALVSDAGLPAVADPGMALISCCHREGIFVTAIPGPCAFATAYALSGDLSGRMQFVGFLPKKSAELATMLEEIHQFPGATVAYESPHRMIETVVQAAAMDSAWEIVLVRELTKIHEEVVRLPACKLKERLEGLQMRGECCLVFLPAEGRERPADELLLAEISMIRQRFSCSVKEAIEIAAKHYRLPQRELYRLCLSAKEG